jgi:hypothetical protein
MDLATSGEDTRQGDAAPQVAPSTAAAARRPAPRWSALALASGGGALLLWALVYLFIAIPGSWFSSAPVLTAVGSRMTVTRGTGHIDGKRLVLDATDPSGTAIVSITTVLRANEYRRIHWIMSGLNGDVDFALLWRSEYAPGQINRAPLEPTVDGGKVDLTPGEKLWMGRIEGLALLVRGKLTQPLVIEAVDAEPRNLLGILNERWHDWFGFAPWNGLSINSVPGGAEEQTLWLPVALVVVVLTAAAACVGLQRWRRWPAYPTLPLALCALALLAWLLLDARWLWSRFEQARFTAAAFAGKDYRERHLVDVDRDLFLFTESVKSKLPPSPARVYMFSDELYFRTRGAYLLLPHNVFVDNAHGINRPVPAASVKPGDYIVAFMRHGMQYDASKQLLRWDGQPPRQAELVLAQQGGVVFKVLQ